MATSDDHSARADFNTGLREFLSFVYPAMPVTDIARLVERFRASGNGVDRPLTSDDSNFYTYCIACVKGQNTSTGFP